VMTREEEINKSISREVCLILACKADALPIELPALPECEF